jgi:polar amino acid transport system substrate-binding protein
LFLTPGFSPYMIIEGVFVVPQGSPLHSVAQVDQPGVRIAVGKGAAYDLHLTRSFTKAELVPYPTSAAVFPALVDDGLDAGAGVRQPAAAFVASNPGFRLIEEAFMQIRQAVAVPIAHAGAIGWLQTRLDAMKQEAGV